MYPSRAVRWFSSLGITVKPLPLNPSLSLSKLHCSLSLSKLHQQIAERIMANSCIASSSSIPRFNTPTSTIFSTSESHSLSHPFKSISLRKLKSVGSKKYCQSSPVKAVYSGSDWSSERTSRKGLWSIRDDLQVPSSPYFPVNSRGQGPPLMVQERFQSVISQLFQHRIIRCGGEVEDEMANTIVAQLLYLDAIDPKKDIVMYVNSPGGSVTAGMAIFDTMRHIRPDVSTVCVGLAASMGAFLLSAGTKGKRYSLPNSRIMIHQPIGGAQGSQTEVEIQVNEMLHHKANLNGYLAYHTGQSLDRINEDTDRDYFMSAKEAKDYGLIDGIILNPLKALRPLAAIAESAENAAIAENAENAAIAENAENAENSENSS